MPVIPATVAKSDPPFTSGPPALGSRLLPNLRSLVASEDYMGFRADADKPERIILAHGRWYDRDGVSELRRAFRVDK